MTVSRYVVRLRCEIDVNVEARNEPEAEIEAWELLESFGDVTVGDGQVISTKRVRDVSPTEGAHTNDR